MTSATSGTTRRRHRRVAPLASAEAGCHQMTSVTWLAGTAALAVAAAVLAAPARADVDTDFSNQLHTYGIYGPKDFNAWIGKIACKRLATHVDGTAYDSAVFLQANLARTTSTEQVWHFLGAGIAAYCPEQTPVLQAAAGPPSSTTVKEQ